LLPSIEQKINRNDWIFIQDSVPSHRANIVQDLLKELLESTVKFTDWPLPRFTVTRWTFSSGIKLKKKLVKIDSTVHLTMKKL